MTGNGHDGRFVAVPRSTLWRWAGLVALLADATTRGDARYAQRCLRDLQRGLERSLKAQRTRAGE